MAGDLYGVPVKADLDCLGETFNKELIDLSITSNATGTVYQVDEKKPIISKNSLKAGSEGGVYIQQVEQNYNLYLAGKVLDMLFPASDELLKNIDILGTFYIDGKNYEIVCAGQLGLNQW